MKTIPIFLILLTLLSLPTKMLAQADSPEETITKILQRQTECWDKGDFDCFMKGYLTTEKLMYIGSSGIKYGWQSTLDSYKKKYPDEASRGTLTFELLEFVPLGESHYLVVGKWSLVRTLGDISGHFSLVWQLKEGEWVIIADHSS